MMKSQVIALFLGATSAVKLNDAPPYFNEPTWNEKHQSAAGFVQLNDAPPYFNEPTWNEKHQSAAGFVQLHDAPPAFNEPVYNEIHPAAAGFVQTSACISSGANGVSCVPNSQLFADGFEGAESLHQNIKMKEETMDSFQQTSMVQTFDAPPFFSEPTWNEKHQSAAGFVQTKFVEGVADDENLDIASKWSPVVVDTPYANLPFCTGTNGADGVSCQSPVCNGTNGPKDGPAGGQCKKEMPDVASNSHSHTTGNLTPQNEGIKAPVAPMAAGPSNDISPADQAAANAAAAATAAAAAAAPAAPIDPADQAAADAAAATAAAAAAGTSAQGSTAPPSSSPASDGIVQLKDEGGEFPEADDKVTPLKLSILETTKGGKLATFY